MKTTYFKTRTEARNFAAENAGKVKDAGKDAEAGKRWSVLTEIVETVKHTAQDEPSQHMAVLLNAVDAVPVKEIKNPAERIGFLNGKVTPAIVPVLKTVEQPKPLPGSIIGEQVLKSPNRKPVQVLWRRNMQTTRLAHIVANAS